MLAELPQAHRVLRHLAHPGRGNRRLHGRMGRRRDEEVRLPQIHHQDRDRRRRLRLHARGDHAPLQATAGRQEADSEPDPDRRRPRPAPRGREALEEIEITIQPLASIAKREEIIYVYGQERTVVLDRRSPVLHLVQQIRDESHRFAVTYHRKRREMRDRDTELLAIPGVGPRTTRRLLEHFGSVQAVKQADAAALSAVVTERRRKPSWGTSENKRPISFGPQGRAGLPKDTKEKMFSARVFAKP